MFASYQLYRVAKHDSTVDYAVLSMNSDGTRRRHGRLRLETMTGDIRVVEPSSPEREHGSSREDIVQVFRDKLWRQWEAGILPSVIIWQNALRSESAE